MEQQSTGAPLSPSPTGYVTRPGVVTFICIGSAISIAVQIIGVVLYTIGKYKIGDKEYFITIVVIFIVLGVFSTIILGLWSAKNWARIAYVVVFPLNAILGLLGNPNMMDIASIPLLAVVCVLLFRPKASAYFRGVALPAIDPASGLEIGDRKIIPCPSCGKEIYSNILSCHHCGADLKQENGHHPAV